MWVYVLFSNHGGKYLVAIVVVVTVIAIMMTMLIATMIMNTDHRMVQPTLSYYRHPSRSPSPTPCRVG